MGLLDRFNRGMSAVQTGLLGNPQVNPALAPYLSPGVLDSANKDARMQMGLAMLAASESGMGFGQGMMMARAAGQQGFQSPIEGDLRANMTADALRRATEQRDEQAKMAQMVATLRAERPDLANLPDQALVQLVVKEKDPSLAIDKEQLVLQQEQLKEQVKNNALDNTRADKQLSIQERQLTQSAQKEMPEVIRDALMMYPGDPQKQSEYIHNVLGKKAEISATESVRKKVAAGGVQSLTSGEKELWKSMQAQMNPFASMLTGSLTGGVVDYNAIQ
jgi:hypothetical protein